MKVTIHKKRTINLLVRRITCTSFILLTSDLLCYLFKVTLSTQFLKAEFGGAAQQQFFTVHALLLWFSRFCLLLLLMVLLYSL